MAGTLLDARLSPETHVWLPLDAEVAGIAGPLARIAARHTPAVGGDETNDILDGLEAGVSILGYGLRARTDAIAARGWEQQGAQDHTQPG